MPRTSQRFQALQDIDAALEITTCAYVLAPLTEEDEVLEVERVFEMMTEGGLVGMMSEGLSEMMTEGGLIEMSEGLFEMMLEGGLIEMSEGLFEMMWEGRFLFSQQH